MLVKAARWSRSSTFTVNLGSVPSVTNKSAVETGVGKGILAKIASVHRKKFSSTTLHPGTHVGALETTECTGLKTVAYPELFSAVIYPDPQGGYNPQFSCDTPNHLQFKGGYQGVFTGWCLCDRDGRVINVVKYWHEPIYLLYETNIAQNLVILFSGILLKLLPPDVIFCS